MKLAEMVVSMFFVAGCGNVVRSTADSNDKDSPTSDAGKTDALVAVFAKTPQAPTAARPMFQGSQTLFATNIGATCSARVAASMAERGFCFLAADDNVKCAGTVGGKQFGANFQLIGQRNATQILLFTSDKGMCVTGADHSVVCMASDPATFGFPSTTQFVPWISRTDVAAIGTGTGDQICGISLAGQVFCGGNGFTNPPSNVGVNGNNRFWIDSFGTVQVNDVVAFRPAEGRGDCSVGTAGLICRDKTFGPAGGKVVSGTQKAGGPSASACWLTSDGSVNCDTGPRFEVGKVLLLAQSSYTDSLCAIYNDGSLWCIGSNTLGKFGTGNDLTLASETMVAPPGSAHVACDP
jgi:hypothetical protein